MSQPDDQDPSPEPNWLRGISSRMLLVIQGVAWLALAVIAAAWESAQIHIDPWLLFLAGVVTCVLLIAAGNASSHRKRAR